MEIQAPERNWAFIPNPLPPRWAFAERLWPLLVKAREALGRLDGIGRTLPKPELLLKPLEKREALRSSSLEGTYASPKDLLLFEIDPKEPKSEDDPTNAWLEVSNHSRALRQGMKLLEELPFCLRFIRELHATLLKGVIRIRRNSCAPVKIGWRDRRISDILSEKREELSDARRTPSSRGPDVTTSAESPTTGCQATRPLSSYSSGPRRPQCPGDRKDPGTQSAVRTAMGLHVSGSRLGSGRPRATNRAASQLTGDGGSVLQGAFPGRPHGGRRCLHAAW